MRFKYLFQVIWYFIITEIITIIDLAVWLQFKDFFISLIHLENDVFGIKYAIPLLLVAIPVISALVEYQSKQKKISTALNNFLRD
ncbi:hypothetical protein J4455_03240 [Candidatus Woesearchaeota archaeon]|nr:hypothetical protein [Candidatus Woesearchaeota archaeon]